MIEVLALLLVGAAFSNLVHTQAVEDQIRRDQMRQATFVLSAHANEDGSCPGRVGEVEGTSSQNETNARAKDFAARLAHAEKVLQHHGGKIHGDEPSATLDELRAFRA